MNRELAKRLLVTYRLGEVATPGSELAEALAFAERDSELAVWLEDQLRFDRELRSSLMEIQPPVGLKEAILRGRPEIANPKRFRPATGYAMAALLALVLGLGFAWVRRSSGTGSGGSTASSGSSVQSFRQQMVDFLADGIYSLERQSESLLELRQFVKKRGGADDAEVPAALAALSGFGCQVLDWQGNKVTLICFTSPRLGFVHLMVLDAPPEAGVGEQPALALVRGWNTALWRRGGRTYLLCAQGSDSDLRSLLGS